MPLQLSRYGAKRRLFGRSAINSPANRSASRYRSWAAVTAAIAVRRLALIVDSPAISFHLLLLETLDR
jgi:hypothetical protein